MQLANPNSSTDASLNALLLAGAAPIATNSGLTVEARAAFPQFDSFLLDAPPEVASTTTDGLPIFPEQIAERAASADHGAVSISCAVALGRWLVETEVPAQTVEEGEEGVDSTVTGSTGETEASKKKEKSVSESPTRLTKAESEKAKNAESAAGALPAESLLIAGYFSATDLPAVELSSDETMESDAGEFSDGVVSADHDAVGEGESIQPRDLPQGTRIDRKSDEMGRSLGELREPHARESVRRESKEVDSPKKPAGDFSTRVVAESVALTPGRDSTERASPCELTGQRVIEDASARRQPLPVFGNPLSRLPVPNNS